MRKLYRQLQRQVRCQVPTDKTQKNQRFYQQFKCHLCFLKIQVLFNHFKSPEKRPLLVISTTICFLLLVQICTFSESHKNISRGALQENQVPVYKYNVYPKQCAFRQTHPLKTTQTVQKIQNVPKRSLSCFPVHSSAQKIPKQ